MDKKSYRVMISNQRKTGVYIKNQFKISTTENTATIKGLGRTNCEMRYFSPPGFT